MYGNGTSGFSGDSGLASAASFNDPRGLIYDSVGNWFFADKYNHRIRKIDVAGIITTIAGTGSSGYSGDGGPASSANLSYPSGLALDSQGNLFIADFYNNVIRKISNVGVMSVRNINEEFMSLYPNPANEVLHIEGDFPGEKLEIRNSIGEVIYSAKFNQRLSIDVKPLASGLYFVHVQNGGSACNKKLIIQH